MFGVVGQNLRVNLRKLWFETSQEQEIGFFWHMKISFVTKNHHPFLILATKFFVTDESPLETNFFVAKKKNWWRKFVSKSTIGVEKNFTNYLFLPTKYFIIIKHYTWWKKNFVTRWEFLTTFGQQKKFRYSYYLWQKNMQSLTIFIRLHRANFL